MQNHTAFDCAVQKMRSARPLDLSAAKWSDLQSWQKQARECLLTGLHYHPGPVDLQAETIETFDHGDYIRECVRFNTAPWFRVEGWFLLPRHVPRPMPAILLLHDWGGPMFFGKDRMYDLGDSCDLLDKFRAYAHGGRYLSETFCRAGYAVLSIDAYHFGTRAPYGKYGIPCIDPRQLLKTYEGTAEFNVYESRLRENLYLSLRQLQWAGTTWAGINFWDDARCVDYLLSRPEVDGNRLGVTGLSGGGYRTNLLMALEDRLQAAASIGWMTTNDGVAEFNLAGAIGTFCLLPGVWNRLDVSDLVAMGFPKKSLVVVGQQDALFPPAGVDESFRQIADAYRRFGHPEYLALERPDKPHCYDCEVQQLALDWFAKWLA